MANPKGVAIGLALDVQEKAERRHRMSAAWQRETNQMLQDLALAIILLADDPKAVEAHKERLRHVAEVNPW